MKKILITGVSLFIAISSFGQMKLDEKTKIILPDGKIIGRDKLDSVNKAWGGKGFMFRHDDQHPDELHLVPMSDDDIKRNAEGVAERGKMINQQAPDFELTDINGKKWSLAALKGKIVVLNFWFTSCVPCMEEMPKLNEVQKRYADSNVVFLGFALDDANVIKKFLKSHAFNYTLLPKSKKIADAYHVSGFPTSFVIDTKGAIRFSQLGGNDIDTALQKTIDGIIKE